MNSGYKNLQDEDFKKLVRYCSIVSFRYNIIGGLNPNAQEDVYNAIALQINSTKKFDVSGLQSVYVSNNSFENDFSTKQFKNTSRNHKIVK